MVSGVQDAAVCAQDQHFGGAAGVGRGVASRGGTRRVTAQRRCATGGGQEVRPRRFGLVNMTTVRRA
jgi:hypothetical protein